MKKIFVALITMIVVTTSYAKDMENPLLGVWNGVSFDDFQDESKMDDGTIRFGNQDKGYEITFAENDLTFTHRGNSSVVEINYYQQLNADKPLYSVVQKGDSDVMVFKILEDNVIYLYDAGDLENGEDPRMVLRK